METDCDPFIQMRNTRAQVGQAHTQGHTAAKWLSLDLKASDPVPNNVEHAAHALAVSGEQSPSHFSTGPYTA